MVSLARVPRVPATLKGRFMALPVRKRRMYLFAYGFLTPIVALFAFLRIGPILYTLYMSLYNWPLIGPGGHYVGLNNFTRLLSDPNFTTAFINTTILAFGISIVSVLAGLLVAAVLARGASRLGPVIEVLFFLPVVAPLVPATLGWRLILQYQGGLLNDVLHVFGVPAQAWTTDPNLAIVSVLLISVWAQVGYNMIIFLVGIRSIPAMYFEAAALDGASGWKTFRHVTLPLISPIVLFVTVITTIQAYNVFTQVYVLASDVQGSPGYLVRVLVYDIFQNAFRYFNMGYAAAEAVYLLLVVLVLTLIQFKLLTRSVD